MITAEVLALKVALIDPAETVTLPPGTVTRSLLGMRLTTAPLLGAAPLRVTVPVEEVPPVTGFGLKLSALTVGRGAGFTVSVALREVEL